METVYDVNYFLAKFEAIPERKWTTGVLVKARKLFIVSEKCCAQGFCLNDEQKNIALKNKGLILSKKENPEIYHLKKLFWNFLRTEERTESEVVYKINNGGHPNYQQPTPKQRILAALRDIKAMQEPKKPEPVVIYKVVEVDSKVKDLTKQQMILN